MTPPPNAEQAAVQTTETSFGNLGPSLAMSVFIGIIGIAIWGYPGAWVATALLPGFILGTTGAHIFRASRKIHSIRPGVVSLGLFLGGVGAFVSLSLFAAAADSVDQRVEASATIDAPSEVVWDRIKAADQRVAWSVMMNDAEDIGSGGPETAGSRYRVRLNIDGATVNGEHEVVAHELEKYVAWKVIFPPGARVQDFTEHVTIAQAQGNTLVTYAITYRVPSVMGRLFNNLRVRSMFQEAARLSITALVKKASE